MKCFELNGILHTQEEVSRLELLLREKTMVVAKEFPLIEWCKQYLTSDGTFIDVGSEVGGFTVMLSKVCKQVCAFEPDIDICAQAKVMIKNNRCPNVEIHNNSILDYELESLPGYRDVEFLKFEYDDVKVLMYLVKLLIDNSFPPFIIRINDNKDILTY